MLYAAVLRRWRLQNQLCNQRWPLYMSTTTVLCVNVTIQHSGTASIIVDAARTAARPGVVVRLHDAGDRRDGRVDVATGTTTTSHAQVM